MTDFLTRVHLHYTQHKFNYYTRFGQPKYRDDVTKKEAYEYYLGGSIFGYVRWEADIYGTQSWRFFVLRSAYPNTPVCKIPGIAPGADILVDVSGQARVRRLFTAIDRIERADIDCADVAPWYWSQTHARINAALDPLPLDLDQHRSWVLERKARS